MQGNEDLLKVFLQYVQRCCSRSSPETAVHLLGRELTDLLNASTVVRPEVRHGAMSAVYAAMTAAAQCDEVCLHAVLGFVPRCVYTLCWYIPLLPHWVCSGCCERVLSCYVTRCHMLCWNIPLLHSQVCCLNRPGWLSYCTPIQCA